MKRYTFLLAAEGIESATLIVAARDSTGSAPAVAMFLLASSPNNLYRHIVASWKVARNRFLGASSHMSTDRSVLVGSKPLRPIKLNSRADQRK